MALTLGDFVWYRRTPHVVLGQRGWFVELIRFGDRRKRTFWRLKRWTVPFSGEDYQHLLWLYPQSNRKED